MPEFIGTLTPPRHSAPPASPLVGQLYYDTDDSKLYYWNGTAWISGGSEYYEQPGTPASSGNGALWVDTDEPAPAAAVATAYDVDPIGTVKAFAGTVIPTNWMLADGRTLARASYPQLADALGVAAGAPSFTIPDLRNRFIYGGSAPGVGATGGAPTHTLTALESGLRAHSHQSGMFVNLQPTGIGGNTLAPYGQGTGTNVTTDTQGPVSAQDAHNNMPPYITMAWIIKVTGATISAANMIVGATGPPGSQPIMKGAKATRLTAFTMQNAAWHVIPFDGEEFDTNDHHDTSTATNRLTCKEAGVYAWACFLMFSIGGFTAGSGFFALNLNKNSEASGGYPVQQGGGFQPMIGGIGPSVSYGGVVTLGNVGDYLTLLLYQNGTGTCTINVGSYFAIWRVG